MDTLPKRIINIRITAEEDHLLSDYCAATGRTRTDVLREKIRSLRDEMQPEAAKRRAAKAKKGGDKQ